MSGDHRGAKIGPRISVLVSQAIVATHNKLLHVKHKLAVMVFNTISNEISDEVDTTIGPIIRQLAANYDANGPAAAYLDFMKHGRGQLKAIAGSAATGQSLTWALGTIISNTFAPDVYDVVGATPNMIPDPASAAQMAAIGALSVGQAEDIIARNGMGSDYARGLIAIARTYPAVTDLITMLQRGVIGEGEFRDAAINAGVPPNYIGMWLAMQWTYLSMEAAALAYLRGGLSREELYGYGELNGYKAHDVDVYLETVGEPPGTQELLEAYRRGFIGQAELERGIRQSRTRDEWIPVIEALRHSPMSIADAVNASVQNHMSQEDAARIAEENGLEPGQFDILYQTAGSPLSRTELNDLYNRGLIGSDVVLQGLRESRLKDKYITDAFALRRRLLEPRTIAESVRNGSMTHDEGVARAMEHGFSAEDAAILVHSASAQKVETFRSRIISQAEALYADNAISREELSATIQGMGFSESEAAFAVQASEYQREARVFAAATNAVRSKYISHHINEQTASGMLDAIGMQATQRDYLLKMWGVEVAANTRVLTPAQVLKAAANNLISQDEADARLQFMGYSAEDAALLLAGA